MKNLLDTVDKSRVENTWQQSRDKISKILFLQSSKKKTLSTNFIPLPSKSELEKKSKDFKMILSTFESKNARNNNARNNFARKNSMLFVLFFYHSDFSEQKCSLFVRIWLVRFTFEILNVLFLSNHHKKSPNNIQSESREIESQMKNSHEFIVIMFIWNSISRHSDFNDLKWC